VAHAGDPAARPSVLGRRARVVSRPCSVRYVSTDAKESTRYAGAILYSPGSACLHESYLPRRGPTRDPCEVLRSPGETGELVGLPYPTRSGDTVMSWRRGAGEVSLDGSTNREAENTYTLMMLPALREKRPDFGGPPGWRRSESRPAVRRGRVPRRRSSRSRPPSCGRGAREPWQPWLAHPHRVCASPTTSASPFVEQGLRLYGANPVRTPRSGA